jgi:hypothetical protein
MVGWVHDAFAEDFVEVVEVIIQFLHQFVVFVVGEQTVDVHAAQVVQTGLLV